MISNRDIWFIISFYIIQINDSDLIINQRRCLSIENRREISQLPSFPLRELSNFSVVLRAELIHIKLQLVEAFLIWDSVNIHHKLMLRHGQRIINLRADYLRGPDTLTAHILQSLAEFKKLGVKLFRGKQFNIGRPTLFAVRVRVSMDRLRLHQLFT